ncbi:hypothetical protein GQ42DRAFT_158610 [Ramicandelaber brevisporus]|nr:hypothetical protein GQ42DRAFT_158610 [Ramicandelaber brevisporus]
MSQLVADFVPVLDATICGPLEGAVDEVVAKFMEALAAADCALTDPPATAKDAPIRPTQVVKHRDELEHAFELQRLCFQASQATIEKLSGCKAMCESPMADSRRLTWYSGSLASAMSVSFSSDATSGIGINSIINSDSDINSDIGFSNHFELHIFTIIFTIIITIIIIIIIIINDDIGFSATTSSVVFTLTVHVHHLLDLSEIQLSRMVCVSILNCADAYGGLQDEGVEKSDMDVVIQLAFALMVMFNTLAAIADGWFKTLEVMSQLIADFAPVLNVTICGLLEGAVGGVVAKFMEALAVADCALTDSPATAKDAPIRPTQVVKHRDELEHAFELQRLCFQASQAAIEKLSDVRQRYSHSQRAEGRPIHLPDFEWALDSLGMEGSVYPYCKAVCESPMADSRHLAWNSASVASISPSGRNPSDTGTSIININNDINGDIGFSTTTSSVVSTLAIQVHVHVHVHHSLDASEIQLTRRTCSSIIMCADAYKGATNSKRNVAQLLASALMTAFDAPETTPHGTRLRMSRTEADNETGRVLLRADIMASDRSRSEHVASTIEVKKPAVNGPHGLDSVRGSIRSAVNPIHTAISLAYGQAGGDLARVVELLSPNGENLTGYGMSVVGMEYAQTVQAIALPLSSLGEVMVVHDPQYRAVARAGLEAVVSEALLAAGFSEMSPAPGDPTATAAARYKQCTVRVVNTLFMLAFILDAELMNRSAARLGKLFNGLEPTTQPDSLGQPAAIQHETNTHGRSADVDHPSQLYPQS